MASRTIWQNVYENPGDNARWQSFRDHYATRVYTWAVRILKGDKSLAEEVTADTFANLYLMIVNPDRKPVSPQDGTCAGFVFRAVLNVCRSQFRANKTRSRLTAELGARLKSEESRLYLERLITEAEQDEERREADRQMEEFARLYAAAVRQYKETQRTLKERGQSWEMFLVAYSSGPEGETGRDLDKRFGCSPGYVLKAAHRVAEALFQGMGLPDDEHHWDRSETLLRELVRRHGDPTC